MVLRADVAPSRRSMVVAVALVVASLTVFILIAEDLLDGGGLISHDEAVLAWFVGHRTDWLVNIARFVSAAAGFLPLLIVGVLFALWLWRRGWKVGVAVAPAVSLSLAGLASTVAKSVFDRARPPLAVHQATVTLAAFPSGHSADAAAFFLAGGCIVAITLVDRRTIQATCIGMGVLLAAIVGVSRLILGVHWLSDVVAGWALGTAVAIAVVITVWYLTTCTSSVGD